GCVIAHQVPYDRPVANRSQRLRYRIGMLPQPRAEPAAEKNDFHGIGLAPLRNDSYERACVRRQYRSLGPAIQRSRAQFAGRIKRIRPDMGDLRRHRPRSRIVASLDFCLAGTPRGRTVPQLFRRRHDTSELLPGHPGLRRLWTTVKGIIGWPGILLDNGAPARTLSAPSQACNLL